MRGYFHTDNDLTLARLAEAVTRADAEGKSFRVFVDNGIIKWKVGSGVWTEPIRSTPDTYRDAPLDWEVDPNPTATVRLFPGPDGMPVVRDA